MEQSKELLKTDCKNSGCIENFKVLEFVDRQRKKIYFETRNMLFLELKNILQKVQKNLTQPAGMNEARRNLTSTGSFETCKINNMQPFSGLLHRFVMPAMAAIYK
jgi:hypothetical protein